MDAKLSAYKEIDYQGPDLLLCPEAKDEYHYAARSKFSWHILKKGFFYLFEDFPTI